MKMMRWWQGMAFGLVVAGGLANPAIGQYAVPPMGTYTDTNPPLANPNLYGFYNAVPYTVPTPNFWYGVRPGGAIQPPTAYNQVVPGYAPRSYPYGRQQYGYNRGPYGYDAGAYGRAPSNTQPYGMNRRQYGDYAGRGRAYGYAGESGAYGTQPRRPYEARQFRQPAQPYGETPGADRGTGYAYGYQSPDRRRGEMRSSPYTYGRQGFSRARSRSEYIAEQLEEAEDWTPTDVREFEPGRGQRHNGYIGPLGEPEQDRGQSRER